MQTYDIVMLSVMAAAILFGMWKGLAWQLASMGSIVLSYLAAFHLREPVSKAIDAAPPWNMFLAMFVLFVGTWIGVWIAFRFVKKTIDKVQLKDFDRHAGAALGAVKGAALCMIVTFFAMSLLSDAQRTAICNSRSGYWMSQTIDHLDAIMPEEIHAQLSPYLEKLDKQLDHNHPDHPDHGQHGLGRHSDEHTDNEKQPFFDSDRAARAILDAAEERLRSR